MEIQAVTDQKSLLTSNPTKSSSTIRCGFGLLISTQVLTDVARGDEVFFR